MMMTMSIAELERAVRRHQSLYDAGRPEISDAEFDKLVEDLRFKSGESPVLLEIGAKVSGVKVRHSVPMLSLGKVYEMPDLQAWAKPMFERGCSLLVQPKYDGLALALKYVDGRLVRATTRGDGAEGEDVTGAVQFGGVAPLTLNVFMPGDVAGVNEVRGELLMPIETFEEAFSATYANARNLIAGLIGRKTDWEPLRAARFVAYDLLSTDTQRAALPMLSKLGLLERFGFNVGKFGTARNRDELRQLVEREWVTPFEIDGLVAKVEDASTRQLLGSTEHHPRWAIAWKYQGQTGKTTLTGVEWEVSRLATITPVVVMEPVELSGVSITRATLHNVVRFRELGVLRVGSELTVTRRGGVIPHIEGVRGGEGKVQMAPLNCPACGAPTTTQKTTLRCTRGAYCDGARRERILFWCRTTGMLGIGAETVKALFNIDLVRTPIDLYKLDHIGLRRAGLGAGESANILEAIAKTRTLSPAVFLQALGIEKLGRTLSRELAAEIDWETLDIRHTAAGKRNEVQKELRRHEDLIDGLLVHVRLEHTATMIAALTEGSAAWSCFAGKKVVFTGALADMDRMVAQALVTEHGGSTPGTLTKETNILVISDSAIAAGTASGKKKKAEAYRAKGLPIEIISEAEFVKRVAHALAQTE
jgi:DNA ligase (NAD+)